MTVRTKRKELKKARKVGPVQRLFGRVPEVRTRRVGASRGLEQTTEGRLLPAYTRGG